MKKSIIVSSIIATVILGGTIIISSAKAKPQTDSTPLLAENSAVSVPSPIINQTKNETVYILADENGTFKTKFIGSTIYDGAEELPFNFKVTYYLDGTEISAKDLAGKSGHIKIIYNYTSTATFGGKFIPFLALTTITLDHANFTNVKLTNGKIIDEKSDNYIIAGYSITGMNENLSTDILPSNFIIEADTTNFKLSDTYTIFTNDILADLDTSKLSTIDNLTNSIYQLDDAITKLINGATELTNGIESALTGTKTLYEGSKTLASSLEEAASGSSEIMAGLNTLTANNTKLQTGASTIITSTLTKLNASGLFPIEITAQNYAQILPEDNEAKLTLDFAIGVIGYTNGVAAVTSGMTELNTGLAKLSAGATTLSNGLGSLIEGETKLYSGSITLRDGLSTFKTAGIDKLVSFAAKDLSNFTRNFRASVNAASSYKNFGNVNAESVKFIIKTPSI